MKQHGALKMGVKVGAVIQRRNKVKSLTTGDDHAVVLAAPSAVAPSTPGTCGWGLLPKVQRVLKQGLRCVKKHSPCPVSTRQ